MFGNTAPFSYSPRGFVPEEQAPFRRGNQQDEPRNAPWQRNSTSRPSGKAIYSQRKEHIDTLNKQDSIHYRVEHLFTCELNRYEANSLDDCMAKLKNLDAKGRLWPQDMLLDVQRGQLQLNDIETKSELESIHLDSILQISTVLDSCAYNSLLAVIVQERFKMNTQIYIFQCEEVGAEFIKSDLDRVIKEKPVYADNHSNQFNIRSEPENMNRHLARGSPQPRAVMDRPPSPPEDLGRQWSSRDLESSPAPRLYAPPSHGSQYSDLDMMQESPPMGEYTEIERDTDILNHVLNDVEFFMGILSATHSTENKDGSGKKNKKKKSQKKGASPPPVDQYIGYLQKVKYGFNLLGKLNGHLTIPSAADFVHILFTSLQTVVPRYGPDIPTKVVSPMLTELALRLLDQEATPEEDQLWRALGESWNVPRTRWPGGDAIPPYIPQFYDGWQIPPRPAQQQHSQMGGGGQHFSFSPLEEPRNGSAWGSTPPTPRQNQPPLYMRAMYDFLARNSQELSVLKGEVVQVMDKTKQWWIIRNNLQEEGHVPMNVLEPMDDSMPMDNPQGSRGRGPPLDQTSSPDDVRDWLEHKGFSRITVQSLSVLSGRQLLGLSRDNLRKACPEEGGKLFFQLQPVKSAIALASEPGYGPYNGRY